MLIPLSRANLYVDGNRQDNYDANGTQERPYRTISEALQALSTPSSTSKRTVISVANGDYTAEELVLAGPCILLGNGAAIDVLTVTGANCEVSGFTIAELVIATPVETTLRDCVVAATLSGGCSTSFKQCDVTLTAANMSAFIYYCPSVSLTLNPDGNEDDVEEGFSALCVVKHSEIQELESTPVNDGTILVQLYHSDGEFSFSLPDGWQLQMQNSAFPSITPGTGNVSAQNTFWND